MKIKINDIVCNVVNFEDLYKAVPMNYHQYLSILFNNLGYDATVPNTCNFQFNIDQFIRSESLDLPDTGKENLIIRFDNQRRMYIMSLYEVLMIIRNLVRFGPEKGKLLDYNKISKLPSKEEIQFAVENKIKIKRKVYYKDDVVVWDRADMFFRRFNNINPKLDRMYFDNNVWYFEDFSKYIKISNPLILFYTALVNPDILLNIIRQTEIESVRKVWNESDKSTPLILFEVKRFVKDFQCILDAKLNILYNLIYGVGLHSLLTPTETQYISMNDMNCKLISNFNNKIPDMFTINETLNQINNTRLDDVHRKDIDLYCDWNSFNILNNKSKEEVEFFFKKLYYLLTILYNYDKSYIDSRCKYILVQDMFIDSGRFVIYNKFRNKYYMIGLDLVVREMDKETILSYYKQILNMEILLDPEDLSEQCIVAKRVPDIYLEDLMKKYINNNTNQNIPVLNQNQSYGFNLNNVIVKD